MTATRLTAVSRAAKAMLIEFLEFDDASDRLIDILRLAAHAGGGRTTDDEVAAHALAELTAIGYFTDEQALVAAAVLKGGGLEGTWNGFLTTVGGLLRYEGAVRDVACRLAAGGWSGTWGELEVAIAGITSDPL